MVQTRQLRSIPWTDPHFLRWLLPLSAVLTLAGYFGPWVPHRVAGLVITGLDLGEYVKFLPVIRSGEVTLWREGFYLPLVAVNLALSLAAFRPRWGYGWPARLLLLAVASMAALNLLPPAWDQSTFSNPEFRLQIQALLICLGAVGISPFLALLPAPVSNPVVLLLSVGALWFPLRDFLRVLPAIQDLYNQPLQPGWGVYLLTLGLLLLIAVHLAALLAQPTARLNPSKFKRLYDHATKRPHDPKEL